MATTEKLLHQPAGPELPHGTVSACTPEDYAALADLYRAAYPDASTSDALSEVGNAGTWTAYRDTGGEIRLAMFAWPNGLVSLLAKPQGCDGPQVVRGFLMLAQHVRASLAQQHGVCDLIVLHPASLNALACRLQREGLLGRPEAILRSMRFDDAGAVERIN